MSRSNYTYFSDGFSVGGMSLDVFNRGKTFYVCNNSVTAFQGIGGSDNNRGNSPEQPLAAIDTAVGKCSANRGDTIVVLPGHAETITTAGGITLDVAGVTIVGVGEGDLRPTISFGTAAAASIVVSASDCAIVGGFIFKCNIANQDHMFDVSADDFRIDGGPTKDIEFLEGSATGLSFITADTADGDSDYFTIRGCRFYCPTAGNYNNAIQFAKDFVGVRVEDCDIYGDFDDSCIDIPAGGNACLNLVITRCRAVNLQASAYAIKINGTSCTGEISDCHVGTDASATAVDNGSLRTYNVLWSSTTDQVGAVSLFTEQDSAGNALGADNADNAFASTNVVSNKDGSVLERLEHLNASNQAGSVFTVVKTFTSSAIPNNTQTGGALTGASSGTLLLEYLILQTDGTGVAGPTNVEISTDNAKGLTGAAGPSALVAVSGLGANKTVVVGYDGSNEKLPLYLESGKKLYIDGDDAAGTGGGTVDVIMVFRRVSDSATIAAA